MLPLVFSCLILILIALENNSWLACAVRQVYCEIILSCQAKIMRMLTTSSS